MKPHPLRVTLFLALFSTASLSAQSINREWRTARVLDAAEAIQAAAADEKHVYAIASRQIAKYERASGKRLALSKGPAKHLNSGFLWNGNLLCAHSNYPAVPERSSIRILDTESMQLKVWRDFGNFGGSLTWVIRWKGHWWCNFARYGDDNGKTFLVQFDEKWNETARYTYPASVIRHLGKFSLSGGIWHDDSLLVTGHDDPVAFRLRLPKAGRVLELVGRDSVPFTGQGFAADPKTGGLIGISRAKRQLIVARLPDKAFQLRILSYNIHHGEGIDGKLDLPRIARVIRSVSPDLVALQEVDRSTRRTNKVDQPARLAELTKMKVVFERNISFGGGEYGNAILSKLPIAAHRNKHLPRINEGEQRGVLRAEIRYPQLGTPLAFFATHLDHRQASEERLASAKVINQLVVASRGPAILAGDLNTTPQTAVMRTFFGEWTSASSKVMPTIPVKNPQKQIDYILFRPSRNWKVVETRVLPEAVASDHRAIFAVLEWVGKPTQ